MHHHPIRKPQRHHTHRRLYAIFFYVAILIGVMVSFPIMVTPNSGIADLNPKLIQVNPASIVAAGMGHSVHLDYDGLVYVWGDNTYSQLGSDAGDHAESAVLVELQEPAVAVSAGDYHTLVVGESGAVYSFGRNAYGQVGNGTVANVSTPETIPGLPPIKSVAAGAYHSLALGEDGSVWAWGHNTQGQVGDVESEEVLGLDGQVLALRNTDPVQIVESGAVAIEAGGNFSLYINEQGQLYAWGDNGKGQLGDGTTDSHPVPELVSGISRVTSVSAGYEHVLALSETSGYRQLFVWGDHSLGQLGLGKLRDQGTLVTRPTLLDITGNLDPSDERLLSIAAGFSQSALVRDVSTARFLEPTPKNELYVWGLNTDHQLAVRSPSSQYTPEQVRGFYDKYYGSDFLPFESIAFGSNHLLVQSTKGLLAAAGLNDSGQLGLGSTDSQVRLTGVPTPDLIRPRWLAGQELQTSWKKNPSILRVKWPEAQDNLAVAGYFVQVFQAGQAPVLLDAGLETTISIPDLDQSNAIQVSVFAYDKNSRNANRDELARLTGYSLPEGENPADYFLPLEPVLAPLDLDRHNWQPQTSGKRLPHEVPWSLAEIENLQKIPGPYTGLVIATGILLSGLFLIMMLVRRAKRKNSLVEMETEREIETG